MDKREKTLLDLINSHKSVIVAYSGGVDSNYLLYVASKANIKLKAVTFNSLLYPSTEIDRAIQNAKSFGVSHEVIDINPLQIQSVSNNSTERCYECKTFLFSKLVEMANKEKYDYIYDGSNLDDLNDYRPGMKACKELGISSPLLEANINKSDIRELSKQAGLNTWSIPSFACYLSRFPYDTTITINMIEKVKKAEQTIHSLGISTARVRYHGEVARIEMSSEDFNNYITNNDVKNNIINATKSAGFIYVAVDLEPYKTGSMNKTIKHHN